LRHALNKVGQAMDKVGQAMDKCDSSIGEVERVCILTQ